MKTTTLNRIREHNPCRDGWVKLLKYLNKIEADDEPLPFKTILESNGIDDALWCTRVAPEYSAEWRLFAVFCARQVSNLLTDDRSLAAIVVAEKFALGKATRDELSAAYEAAAAAVKSARDTADAYTDAYTAAAAAAAAAAAYTNTDAYTADAYTAAHYTAAAAASAAYTTAAAAAHYKRADAYTTYIAAAYEAAAVKSAQITELLRVFES